MFSLLFLFLCKRMSLEPDCRFLFKIKMLFSLRLLISFLFFSLLLIFSDVFLELSLSDLFGQVEYNLSVNNNLFLQQFPIFFYFFEKRIK